MHQRHLNNRFESHLIENREVRIFLSSTFSDMDAERSALVKRFDKLKLKANRRNVSLSLLDLRWGVTDEEARTGKVLSVCLNEIENSHPFFIGLLGSRYGYAPRMSEIEKNPDLEERYPWICEDIAQERSITEIEMQYGVLRNQEDVDATFFIKAMPDTLPDDSERLTSLKSKIRHQQRFPVGEYTSIENLCDQVEKTVTSLLDKYYSDADNTRLGRERNIQRAYMNSRHKFYVRNQKDFDRLNEFLRNNERYLAVTGASGMGKSALIANWLKEVEKQEDCPYNIIFHFVGNTFGGNDYEEVLQHISDEIFDLYKGIDVRLGNTESAEEKAQRYMNEALLNGKPLLIVIDGVDQLSNRGHAKLLNWLPQSAVKLKYIFSTLETDDTMQLFLSHEYPVITIGHLSEEQRYTFIVNYLACVGKKLSNNQIQIILQARVTENPMVLKTLLDELICFGSYEHLNERINYYSSSISKSDFFSRMLQRMEEDYKEVEHILSLIAVSEQGLTEDEILSVTGMRPIDWHIFYCAFSNYFTIGNGLIMYTHKYIAESVSSRYHIANENNALKYRTEIIRYFLDAENVDYERKTSELAFQYYKSNNWKQLYQTILDFDAFVIFDSTDKGREHLALYWRQLLEVDSKQYQLRNYLDLPYENINIEDLLYREIGLFVNMYFSDSETSMKYYQTYELMLKFSGMENDPYLASCYNNIASEYCDNGKFDEAEESYLKAIAIYEETLGREHLDTATTYHNLGENYMEQGNYVMALNYFDKALRVREKKLGVNSPETADTYNGLASVNKHLGNFDIAEEMYVKALKITESSLGVAHPKTITSYNNYGLFCLKIEDWPKAIELFSKALTNSIKILGMHHLLTASIYNNLSSSYYSLKDYKKALEYANQSLEIVKKVYGEEHSKVGQEYNNIAMIYLTMGELRKSAQFLAKAKSVLEETLDSSNPLIATIYYNIGTLLCEIREYSKALEYLFKALDIRKKISGGTDPDTATAYNGVGIVYYYIGNLSKSLEYLNKAKNVYMNIFGIQSSQVQQCNRTIELVKTGNK